MAQAAWGTKRHCPSCGAPFYDLNRHPAVCPKCHAEYVAAPRLPTRSFRGQGKAIAAPAVEETGFEGDEVIERDDEHEESDETLIGGEVDDDGDEMRD